MKRREFAKTTAEPPGLSEWPRENIGRLLQRTLVRDEIHENIRESRD